MAAGFFFILPGLFVSFLTEGSLTCALSKVLHDDILVLPAGDGPQLALVGIGHPIGAAHLRPRDEEKMTDGWMDALSLKPRPHSLFPTHLCLVPLIAVWGRALTVGLAVHLYARGSETTLELVARGRSLRTWGDKKNNCCVT